MGFSDLHPVCSRRPLAATVLLASVTALLSCCAPKRLRVDYVGYEHGYANAQFLLQPVSPEQFYSLYTQGWRVDQLFRLMVDRIELTVRLSAEKKTITGCSVVSIQ
jgi:hypothetical protein